MRNPLLGSILGLLLISAPLIAQADFSKPVGIWDLHGKADLKATIEGKTYHLSKKVSLSSFIQFKGDGGYTVVPWSTTAGHWRSSGPKGKAFKVTFDAAAVAAGASTPAFLNGLLNNFSAVAKGKFGTAPQLKAIAIKTYSDRGQLTRKGLQLKGINRINVDVTYTNPVTSQDEISLVKAKIDYTGARASAPSTCCTGSDAAQNLADSQAFLDENKTLPGVQTTASGLQYMVIKEGSGDHPVDTSKVTIAYRGILPDGQKFDVNSNATFALTGVIPGFREGLELMTPGSYYRLYIPSDLAYGVKGSGAIIKPNTALIFDVVLSKIQ